MPETYLTNSQKPVLLNRELPFVKAVFDVIEGRGELDAALQILKDEEHTHGVCIIYDEDDKYYALGGDQLVPKQKPLNASEMLALARTDWDKFMENYVPADATACATFQLKLNRFLDATSLILQGSEFTNMCLLTLDDGSIWTFAYREWGEYLSEWANQNEWMQQFGSFDYVDFAFYCDKVIKDYQQWADIAFAAIQQKCSTQLQVGFLPENGVSVR